MKLKLNLYSTNAFFFDEIYHLVTRFTEKKNFGNDQEYYELYLSHEEFDMITRDCSYFVKDSLTKFEDLPSGACGRYKNMVIFTTSDA